MTRTEHLLTCLSEECAEVTQIVSKILRFGIDDMYLHFDATNRDLLEREVNDILGVIEMLKNEGINIERKPNLIQSKIERIESYIDYAKKHGTLI